MKAQNQTAAFLWVVNSLYCCCFPTLRLLCMAPFSSKIRFPFDKLANKWWGGSLWRFFIGKVFHLGGTLNQRTQKKTKFLCTRKSDEEKVDNLLLSLSLWLAFREMLSGYYAFVEECNSLFSLALPSREKFLLILERQPQAFSRAKEEEEGGRMLSSSKPKPKLLCFRYTSSLTETKAKTPRNKDTQGHYQRATMHSTIHWSSG